MSQKYQYLIFDKKISYCLLSLQGSTIAQVVAFLFNHRRLKQKQRKINMWGEMKCVMSTPYEEFK